MNKNFKVIAFDADDTLWVNEPYYYETEKEISKLLSNFLSPELIPDELFKTEMQNLKLYGYGAKGFMLSMIETAIRISDKKVSQLTIEKIINLGKGLLTKPIELLAGVHEVLEYFNKKKYKLIVATKGDLLDQERKLKNSGLEKFFHHVEIMSYKQEDDYLKLINHLEIETKDFLMIGNSLKSDILPVLNIGGSAIYIPYQTTWAHEKTEQPVNHENFKEITNISELKQIIT